MMKNSFVVLLLILVPLIGAAQYRNIIIAEDTGRHAPEEPSIVINPQNPDQIAVGANIRNAYHSVDGGKTWKRSPIKSPYGVYGDPCLVADNEGTFYFFHLSDPAGKGWSNDSILDRMVCQRSTDGGASWDSGTYFGLNGEKDQDKEWAVVAPDGDIYVTWTQFDDYGSEKKKDSTHILFTKSEDKGETWSVPLRINQIGGDCKDGNETVEGAVPAAGPNGEIYVAWSLGDNIYFDRSLNGGKEWMQKDLIAVQGIGGWNLNIPGIMRSNGMPITLCDLSGGQNHGTIYICWADQRNGEDDTDVWLAYSKDQGTTWSDPIRINNDKAGKHQFFPWMAIDQVSGMLYVVYYDRREYTDNQTDVYLAVSSDGGNTFINERISESPFTPKSTVFFGDYINIAAHNGRIRPVWTHYEDGKLSIRTVLIDRK